MKIAVFCSGNGSNFQAIVDASKKGLFKGKVALMVCDNPAAYAIKRAESEGIKTFIIERSDFSSRQDFEARIIQELEKEKIELIALAGYMRILSPAFVERYRNRILNIHPAILPSFKGTQAIKEALDYGVKLTGVTVHFVNEDMDCGPIILQEAVEVNPEDSQESLTERIHSLEHRLYPEAIRLVSEGNLKVKGRRVNILAAVAVIFLALGFEPKAMFGREVLSPLPPQAEAMVCRGTVFPLALKGDILPLTAKDNFLTLRDRLGAEKGPGLNLEAYQRLKLATPCLYDINNEIGPRRAGPLNLELEIERPLSKEEITRMKIKTSIKVARAFAEAMDSVNAEFAYNGINSLVDTACKVIDLRDSIAKKYNLHLRVESDQALLRYKKRF